MSVPTARKYLRADKLSSILKQRRIYRTHPNPFANDWPWVEQQLQRDPALQAKTPFTLLCERFPDRYTPGQLRTFQHHVAQWPALSGPEQEGAALDVTVRCTYSISGEDYRNARYVRPAMIARLGFRASWPSGRDSAACHLLLIALDRRSRRVPASAVFAAGNPAGPQEPAQVVRIDRAFLGNVV
jgi:hypothetical protein